MTTHEQEHKVVEVLKLESYHLHPPFIPNISSRPRIPFAFHSGFRQLFADLSTKQRSFRV